MAKDKSKSCPAMALGTRNNATALFAGQRGNSALLLITDGRQSALVGGCGHEAASMGILLSVF